MEPSIPAGGAQPPATSEKQGEPETLVREPGPGDPIPPESAAEIVKPTAGGAVAATTKVDAEGPTPEKRTRKREGLWAAFLPNRSLSPGAMQILIALQVLIALLIWMSSPYRVLPKPGEVLTALSNLWMRQGLGQELIASFKVNVEALILTALISLVLSYLTVLPFFRPIVAAISKGRFLSLFGFTFVFMLMVGGGHPLKLSLLVFGMTVFFLTSMAAVIQAIPK